MQVDVRADQAILAVVGEGMKGRPGVAGKVFDSLGRQNINISAIAQGASERNISCVIDASQQVRALNAIHQGFFETSKRLALAIIGVGNVGGAVLRQLEQQRALPAVEGVRRHRRRAREQQAVPRRPERHRPRRLEGRRCGPRPTGWTPKAFARRIGEMELTNVALVDCTVRSGDRRRLSGVHRGQPAHHHAEQVGERAAVAALRRR